MFYVHCGFARTIASSDAEVRNFIMQNGGFSNLNAIEPVTNEDLIAAAE